MKKLISVLLLSGILLSLPANAAALESDTVRYVHGDADCDGELSVIDTTFVQRYDLNLSVPVFDTVASDYNSDGDTDIIDATMIQRRLAGIPNTTLETYSQMNKYTAGFVSEGNYFDDNHDYSMMPDYIPVDRSTSSRPASYILDIPKSGTLYLWDGDRSISYQVETGSFEVWNMTPGNEVTYLLTDKRGNKVKAGLLYPTGKVRMINGGGKTFNIRDIGGWACDGGTLKYGLVYRGCELSGDNYNVNINEEQIRMFRDLLGIRDEIDTRSDAEVDGADRTYGTDDDITSSALGDDVGYVRYTAAPYAAGVNLRNPYQKQYYCELIKRISADVKSGTPCYTHCMAGADRTGTLCALIEAICGVSLSDIEKDYELTSLSPESARLRTNSEWKGLVEYLESLPGDSLRDKAVYFALQTGVSEEDIQNLREGLINGEPSPLFE